jgi:hypothetical protein
MSDIEHCVNCGDPTGKAGEGEDSLFCNACGEGPFCERCDEEHQCRCGLCGEPGADKIAHPVHWPGERVPDGNLVHAECEREECKRAYAALSDTQRRAFLKTV